ncbi:MAG: ankyrin repeat domain-containing protein [Burkholderiaceae bacterium]
MVQPTNLGRIAELLVRHGAEVSSASVIHAAGLCDLDLLRSLVRSGAPINDRDDRGRTPLILAAGFGDLEVVEFLLQNGANAHSTDSAGLNAADWSVVGGFQAVTRRLSAAGVSLSHAGNREALVAIDLTRVESGSVASDTYLGAGLIHITASGVRVRSKSEIVIADALFYMGIPFEYELPFIGSRMGGMRLPDFTIRRNTGQLILWEHLGMLHDDGYRASWSKKLDWYKQNRLVEGQTLFITRDDPRGGLDSRRVNVTAREIQSRLGEK